MADVPYNPGTVRTVAPDAPRAPYQRGDAQPAAFGVGGDSQALARGLMQISRTIGTVDADAEREKERYDATAADSGFTRLQTFGANLLHGDPTRTTPGPDGKPMPDLGYFGTEGAAAMRASPEIVKAFDSQARTIAATLTPTQREIFDKASARYRNSLVADVNGYANKQQTAWEIQENKASIAASERIIAVSLDNPQALASAFSDIQNNYARIAEINGAEPGSATWNDALAKAREVGLSTQIQAEAVRDPLKAQRILDKNRQFLGTAAVPLEKDLRAPVMKANARTEADRIIAGGGGLETWMRKARAIGDPDLSEMVEGRVANEFNRRDRIVREARADARATVSLYLEDTMKSLEATGEDPGLLTSQDIRAAYSDDPKRGEYVVKQMRQAKDFYRARTAIAMTTPEEDAKVMRDLMAPGQGEGVAQRLEQARAYQAALDAKRRALQTDPAAYVMRNSPSLARDLAASNGDPAKMRPIIERSLQMQSDLGVPEWDRRILSDAQVDAIAGRFGVQPEGGENAATLINQMRKSYGDLWPDVVGELVRKDKLPPAINVLGQMPPGRAASSLAEALKLGEKGMKDALNKDDVQTLKDRIPDALADFRLTLGPVAGGAKAYSDFAKATELLALKYMGEGDKPADAVDRAARDTVLDRYQFSGTYRVPRDQPAKAVNAGAAYAKTLALPDNIDVPRHLAGIKEEDARASYRRSVMARGFWVAPAPPYDKGLVLYDETMSAVTVGGRPYFLSWSDLAAKGLASVPVIPPEHMSR